MNHASEELKNVTIEAERSDYELTLHLENLTKIDIVYVSPDGLYPGRLKIEKERYFKHFGLEQYENRLDNPEYPDVNIRNKFPKVPTDLAQSLGRGISSVQERWLNPPVYLKYNLRPVPDSAYRWNGSLVKSTK